MLFLLRKLEIHLPWTPKSAMIAVSSVITSGMQQFNNFVEEKLRKRFLIGLMELSLFTQEVNVVRSYFRWKSFLMNDENTIDLFLFSLQRNWNDSNLLCSCMKTVTTVERLINDARFPKAKPSRTFPPYGCPSSAHSTSSLSKHLFGVNVNKIALPSPSPWGWAKDGQPQ